MSLCRFCTRFAQAVPLILVTAIAVAIVLSNTLDWSASIGQVDVYQVSFQFGLTSWDISYSCKDTSEAPCESADAHVSGTYDGANCIWSFCKPCHVASKHMTSFAYAAMGFILANLVISGIRVHYQISTGFTTKFFGVVTAALVLTTCSAVFLTWISSCQNRFDDFSYMIGSIRVVQIKPTLQFGFMLAVFGSFTALLSVLSETCHRSFNAGEAEPLDMDDSIDYALVEENGDLVVND